MLSTVRENDKQAWFIYCNGFSIYCFFVTVPSPKVTGSDVSVVVGRLAVLTCSVSSNPSGTTVTYQWKRAGELLATSALYNVSSSVGVFDAGVYICEVTVSDSASNLHVISGTGSVDVTLIVTSK